MHDCENNVRLPEFSQIVIFKMFKEEKGNLSVICSTGQGDFSPPSRLEMSLSSSLHRSTMSGG